MRLILFVLLLVTSLPCAASQSQQDYAYDDGDADDEDRNPVKVASKHLDPENTLILRQGKPLMVECVYGREDIADISDLQWQKKGAKVIDGSSSSSIFTTGLLEHGTRHKKKNLHFTAIHKRDEGTYECRARSLGGKTYSREVKVVVLNEIRWNDESHSAGALLGEPLTIDCGVNGDDEDHQITITDSEGETLDASMYTIAGKEVTVERLTKEYDGKKISCVHIESYGKDELPIIDRREVNIDVWCKWTGDTCSDYLLSSYIDKNRHRRFITKSHTEGHNTNPVKQRSIIALTIFMWENTSRAKSRMRIASLAH